MDRPPQREKETVFFGVGFTIRWWPDQMEMIDWKYHLWRQRADLAPILDLLSRERRHGAQPQALRSLIAHLISALAHPPKAIPHQAGGLTNAERQIIEVWLMAGHLAEAQPHHLAAKLGLNPRYFCRKFKKHYGISPQSWLSGRRLEEAAEQLLKDQTPIGLIADRYGYADIYTFSRQFKKHHGLSPRHFREQWQ